MNTGLMHEKTTGAVMEAAMEVLHALRPGFDIGLLVNFSQSTLPWKRAARSSHPGDPSYPRLNQVPS
jgi:hypothetical protein